MSKLLEQGIELMLAGMLTVFFFLCILIISINFFALILNKKNDGLPDSKDSALGEINTNHMRIIKEIGDRI
ncbi:OadG family protein [Gammaproteobacteria bacterium]|nr:OadG family protein [Gammaproteobacteria bacterium]MDA7856042.1 OadG family protein [Gammaproteobacteria bacterium]MDA9039400.1 OadG family protein [Gammaproteobacteria bacterium]MDA9045331.1 OadG family protein [Gammaproteobacteria bacterium]MDA9117613.1 OadG family protein [Gammaproteobacteria bacterium]